MLPKAASRTVRGRDGAIGLFGATVAPLMVEAASPADADLHDPRRREAQVGEGSQGRIGARDDRGLSGGDGLDFKRVGLETRWLTPAMYDRPAVAGLPVVSMDG